MNARLEELIAEARARGPMTPAEIDAQRHSFARAEAGFGSDEDEAAYAAALRAGDAAEVARLDREAEGRMAAADRYFEGERDTP